MPSLQQRAQPRVKYPVEVRLQAPTLDHVLVAYSLNLSINGMLVEAREPLEVGTPLTCEIPLPGGARSIAGLVARVQPLPLLPSGCGLGIRFLEVDPDVEEVLRGLVQSEEPLSRLARVRFEGLKEILRSQAVPTADGIRLATVLPFLRMGSEVSVSFVSGSSRVLSRGVVRDVTFEPRQADGIPRLAVNVQFPREREPDYVPIDEGEEVTAVDHPSGLAKANAKAAAGRAAARSRAEPLGPARPTLDARALSPARSRRPLRLRGRPRTAGAATVRVSSRRHATSGVGGWAARLAPVAVAGVALVATVAILARQTPPRAAAARLAEPAPRPAPPGEAPVPPPQAPRVELPGAPPDPEPELVASPPPPSPPEQPPPAGPFGKPADPNASAPPQFPHDPLTGLPPLPAGTPGPTMTVPTPTELQAEVPFAGSAQGAIHFALAQPRGLAVTLPNARSVLPIGRHVLGNEGFRYVWIREPERGGIQVRFMFAERTPVLRALEVDQGVVRVRVAPLPPESQ
jgi:hypothetical protein